MGERGAGDHDMSLQAIPRSSFEHTKAEVLLELLMSLLAYPLRPTFGEIGLALIV